MIRYLMNNQRGYWDAMRGANRHLMRVDKLKVFLWGYLFAIGTVLILVWMTR